MIPGKSTQKPSIDLLPVKMILENRHTRYFHLDLDLNFMLISLKSKAGMVRMKKEWNKQIKMKLNNLSF